MRRLYFGYLLGSLLLSPGVQAATEAQELFQKGSQALARNQTQTAIRYFEEALELNSDLVLAWRGLGVAFGQAGRWSDSVKAHRRATRLQPQVAQGWLNLGWAEHRAGNDKVAAKVLQHAAELDANNPEIPNALGVVYLFLNQPLKAETATRRVLTLAPTNATAYYNLGLALHRQGRWSEGITALQQAQRYEPRNPHPAVALAITYQSAGDGAMARAAYIKAVQLDPRYRRLEHLQTLIAADFSQAQVEIARQVYRQWQR